MAILQYFFISFFFLLILYPVLWTKLCLVAGFLCSQSLVSYIYNGEKAKGTWIKYIPEGTSVYQFSHLFTFCLYTMAKEEYIPSNIHGTNTYLYTLWDPYTHKHTKECWEVPDFKAWSQAHTSTILYKALKNWSTSAINLWIWEGNMLNITIIHWSSCIFFYWNPGTFQHHPHIAVLT